MLTLLLTYLLTDRQRQVRVRMYHSHIYIPSHPFKDRNLSVRMPLTPLRPLRTAELAPALPFAREESQEKHIFNQFPLSQQSKIDQPYSSSPLSPPFFPFSNPLAPKVSFPHPSLFSTNLTNKSFNSLTSPCNFLTSNTAVSNSTFGFVL